MLETKEVIRNAQEDGVMAKHHSQPERTLNDTRYWNNISSKTNTVLLD